MNLIWLEPALEQLETILDYIAERNEDAAERLQSAIEACADALPDHPFLYRPGRVPGRAKRWCIPITFSSTA